jgi:hypothetical protein
MKSVTANPVAAILIERRKIVSNRQIITSCGTYIVAVTAKLSLMAGIAASQIPPMIPKKDCREVGF